MRSYTPLRYPGGKAKIYNQVKKLIENNFDKPPIYVEGFAGGAGLAIKLLMTNVVKKIHINDSDYSIYAFWYSIINYRKELIDLISTAKLDIKEWEKQKNIYQDKFYINHSILEIGFATFYLNRTNRSGILLAGPIGGKKQNGNYLMDCRFNKKRLIELINKIYDYKDKIHISNEDARTFIRKIDSKYDNAFIYLDPPYVQQGQNLYRNAFTKDNHESLKVQIDKLKNKWLLTYDNVELIANLYKEYRMTKFNIQYSLANKGYEKEIAIFSDNLQVEDLFIRKEE